MARDKAIPGPDVGPDGDIETDAESDRDVELEQAFRRRLDDEMAHHGSRPMADVVARAASRGRRRVLVRAGSIVASVVAVVAVGGAATLALQPGDTDPERAAIPVPTVARRTVPAADGGTEVARAALARDLGTVLSGLLPAGNWSAARTGYAPETGISAEVTRDDGLGPVGVVSVSLRPGDLADCRGALRTAGERTDEFGLKHNIKCLAPEREGQAVATEGVQGPDGIFRAQALYMSVGSGLLRVLWANGPLDGKFPQTGKPRPALTDQQGAEIARSPRWEPVARRLPATFVGTG
ncbi:hypothetical protein [Embleya sp. NPDC059259]|uniref:hypothetical protein n=1 Tax=unclassified Embleya TaxID=2699296 RepID=UPI0036BC798D